MQDIVAAADAVVAAVNEQDLAQWKALKNPPEGDEHQEKKKEMEAAEAALIDALHRKANALLELEQVRQSIAAAHTCPCMAPAAYHCVHSIAQLCKLYVVAACTV